ncbi:MAG: Asr1405/Asl0597 family protein [Synechococcus sp.]
MEYTSSEPETSMQVIPVPRQERWRIRQRLQELSIPVMCTDDGHLHVEVKTCVAALQIRSVLRQFRAQRTELVDWLEECWRQTYSDRTA